jgi:hypothetical protein
LSSDGSPSHSPSRALFNPGVPAKQKDKTARGTRSNAHAQLYTHRRCKTPSSTCNEGPSTSRGF